METINTELQVACDACQKSNAPSSKFCLSCGFPILGTEVEKKKFLGRKKVQKINLEEFEGKIKSARTTLFVIAGLTSLYGLIMMFVDSEGNGLALLITNLIIAGVYLALGFWCKQKPFAAILSGLIIYITIQLFNAFEDPHTIYKGIILKIFIITYLVKGLKSAKEAEELRKELDSDLNSNERL